MPISGTVRARIIASAATPPCVYNTVANNNMACLLNVLPYYYILYIRYRAMCKSLYIIIFDSFSIMRSSIFKKTKTIIM